MTGLLGLLLIGLLLALGGSVLYSAWMLTHPPRRTYASGVAAGRPGDPDDLPHGPTGRRDWLSWSFSSRGRDLPVWDIAGDSPQGPVFILTHGWGDSRVGGLSRAHALAPLASRLILWDMPGHGESKGLCRLGSSEHTDLAALIERVGRDRPIILYGWSLGAGISIVAATSSPGVAGVIAEAPYRLAITPARNVHVLMGLPHHLNLPLALGALGMVFSMGTGWKSFDRAAWASRLRCPLLVLHGEADDVCPPEDGQTIAQAAGGVYFPIPRLGHHGLWTNAQTARLADGAVRRFLLEALAQSPVSTSTPQHP